MAKNFVQDPFNPIYFPEDSEKVESIICIATSYKYNQDEIAAIFSCLYLAFEDGEDATDPRTPLLRELPPLDAGFRCLAEDRSAGGSPRPCERREKKVQ